MYTSKNNKTNLHFPFLKISQESHCKIFPHIKSENSSTKRKQRQTLHRHQQWQVYRTWAKVSFYTIHQRCTCDMKEKKNQYSVQLPTTGKSTSVQSSSWFPCMHIFGLSTHFNLLLTKHILNISWPSTRWHKRTPKPYRFPSAIAYSVLIWTEVSSWGCWEWSWSETSPLSRLLRIPWGGSHQQASHQARDQLLRLHLRLYCCLQSLVHQGEQ